MLYKVIQGDLLRGNDSLLVSLCKSAQNIDVHSVGEIQTMGEGGRLSLTPVPGSHQSISASANCSSWEVEGQWLNCILSSEGRVHRS